MADRTIAARLVLNVQDFVAGTRQAHKSLDDLVKASGKADVAASTGLGRMQQSMELRRNDWSTASSALLKVGAAQGVVTAAVAATGIQYNMLQQTSRAALKTLTGSASEANAQMDRLDAFAKTSPFSKSTFIQAQQQMLAFGIESKKVIPYLDSIQNAVAAAGGNDTALRGIVEIMAKIKSSAKITGQDLMQFGNWGVDAAGLIGAAMGKTGAEIRTAITEGAIDADTALDALAKGMGTKFAGAASNVKNTLAGAFDRVKAAFRDLSSSVMEPFVGTRGGGILTGFLNTVADVLRAVEKLPTPVKNAGAALFGLSTVGTLGAGALMKLVPAAVDTHKAFFNLANDGIPVLSKAIQRFQAVPGQVASSFSQFIAGFGQYNTAMRVAFDNGAGSAGALRAAVVPVLRGIQGAAQSAGKALLGMFGGPVGLGITGLVAGLTVFASRAAEAQARAEGYASALSSLGDDAGLAERQMAIAREALERVVTGRDLDWGFWQSFRFMREDVGSFEDALADAGLTANDFARAVAGMPGAVDQYRNAVEGAYQAGIIDSIQRDEMITKLEQQITSTGLAKDEVDALAEGERNLAGETDGATAATEAQAEAQQDAAEAAEAHRKALENLASYQRGLADSIAAADAAETQWIETLENAGEALEENAGGFDKNTESGRENWQMNRDLVDALNKRLATMIEAKDVNGDFLYTEEEINRVRQEGVDAINQNAEALGGANTELEEYNANVLMTPDEIVTQLLLRADGAKVEADSYRETLESLPAEVLTALMATDNASLVIDGVINLLDAGMSGEYVAELLAQDNATGVIDAVVAAINAGYSIEHVAQLLAEDEASVGVLRPLQDRLNDLVSSPYVAQLQANDNASGPARTVKGNVDAIPKNPTVEISARDYASGTIQSVRDQIRGLNGAEAAVTITRSIIERAGGRFKGGFVPGLAAGGWVPGRRAGFDNVHWPLRTRSGQMLSQPLEGREFVVNSAAAARNAPVLEAINNGANLRGLLPGLFGGGVTGASVGVPPMSYVAPAPVAQHITVEARLSDDQVRLLAESMEYGATRVVREWV